MTARAFGGEPTTRFPKDGIGDHVIGGADTVNPDGEGTKAAAHVRLQVPGGGQSSVLVRLTRQSPDQLAAPLAGADELIAAAAGRGGRVLRVHHSPAGHR